MKNAIKVLCFVLAVLVAGAVAFYIGFIWDLNEFEFVDGTEKGTVIVTGYIGSDKDVVIPKTLRGKRVVEIADFAFRNKDITSVKVGNNVKTVGDNVFQGCKKLVSVDLGDSVENLGTMVFADCSILETVKFSPVLKDIGYMLFRNNLVLEDIDLNGNTNFKVVDGIIYSGDMSVLFETLYTADLTGYVMPETVTELKEMAFYSHDEIKSIKLNQGIKNIPMGCFASCKGLTDLVVPDTVTTIGASVIVDSNIKTITVPKSVVKIDDLAFLHNEVAVEGNDDNGDKNDKDEAPEQDSSENSESKPEIDILIITTEGSFASTFARRHGYELKIVSDL